MSVFGVEDFDWTLACFDLGAPAEAFTPLLTLDFLLVFLLPRELAVVGTKMAMDCPGLSATGIFNLFQAAMFEGETS